MTNEELIDKIKAEVERLENYYTNVEWYVEALVTFLSTLESEKPLPNDLEEAAEEYLQKVKAVFLRTLEYPTAKDAFISGAKWDREQMLKTAEECELYWDGDFLAIDLNMAALGYSERDKVRVIVLPKED